MDPFTMALVVGGLGSAASIFGRMMEPPAQKAPNIDESLFDSSNFDNVYRQAMNDYRSQQVLMGEMRNDMRNAMNEYRDSINMMMQNKEALVDQPSVVDAQMDAALDQSLKNQTSLAGTIGGANAGLQQQQLMNQAASQQQGIAQQAGIGRLQEDIARRQMDRQYNQMLLGQQANISGMRSNQFFNQQGANQNTLNQASNAASQSAGVKANLQNARNQQFQLDQSERDRVSQANAAMTQGIATSLGSAAQIYGAKKAPANKTGGG